MVMEAPPSPQCVGREFVRQYYTLLNQAPAHLHRFYNNNSSFVHGGLDAPNRETKPVVGQKQIHQKIQQLNFRDCHAKISQVDSQATLGNGVVVQVTGELSNSGQPMRRFTQTFVLAAQSPKKYYVHNDIFRYQDMMFSDEEVEQDSGHSAAEEDVETEHTPTAEAITPSQLQQSPQTMAYYNSANNNAPVVNPQQPPQPVQVPPPQMGGALPHQMVPPPATAVVAAPPAAVVNGSAHPEEVIHPAVAAPPVTAVVVPAQQQQPVQQAVVPAMAPPQQQPAPANVVPIMQAVPAPVPAQPVHMTQEEEGLEEEEGDIENTGDEEFEEDGEAWADEPEGGVEDEKQKPQQEMEDTHHLNESASSEPKTYATLVKTGGIGGVGTGSFSSSMSTSPNTPAKPTTSPPPMNQRPMESRDSMQMSNAPSGAPGGMGQGQRGARRGGGSIRGMGGTRPDRGGPARGSFTEESANGDGDRRRSGPNMMQQYSDTQQLFMGNLPHSATEEDLRELFSEFGNIIDLRIHSKQNVKGVSGNRVPNYGFIIFENASTVQTVLSNRPIYFPKENGQKLNVEEKKTKPRPMDGGRMGSGGDSMLGGGRPTSGMGGPRGGGPGGMMRGSPMGHNRGGGRGGFSRGDGRGGGMNRGSYTRR
ncbi:ras GTPase-activating protein-binding protein 2 [Anabrus simplex]|uniref:ras GTPase-activating protein-binding protein 2 n=1 Tax=Anabrus simplex TaxID=316456 RepID=UPI0034DCE6C2